MSPYSSTENMSVLNLPRRSLLHGRLPRNKAQWDKYFEGYKDYVKETGQQPPWTFTCHKGVSIGQWLHCEILPKKASLSPEQIRLLEQLGLDWNLTQVPDTPGAPSREELQTDYQGMSLGDLSRKHHVTQHAMLKLLKFHGLSKHISRKAGSPQSSTRVPKKPRHSSGDSRLHHGRDRG